MLVQPTPYEDPATSSMIASASTQFSYLRPDPPPRREALKAAFVKLNYCQPGDERPKWVPCANIRPSEDYTNAFLSHARLYVFAEKFDIQPLKRLVLENVHQTLTIFRLWPDCVSAIVSLLQYVYANTLKPSHGEEPMRSLLKRYICYEMETMSKAASFRKLLGQDSDLLDDFCLHLENWT